MKLIRLTGEEEFRLVVARKEWLMRSGWSQAAHENENVEILCLQPTKLHSRANPFQLRAEISRSSLASKFA